MTNDPTPTSAYPTQIDAAGSCFGRKGACGYPAIGIWVGGANTQQMQSRECDIIPTHIQLAPKCAILQALWSRQIGLWGRKLLSSSLPGLSVVVAIALATSLNTLMMVMGAGIALLVVVGGCGARKTGAVAGGAAFANVISYQEIRMKTTNSKEMWP